MEQKINIDPTPKTLVLAALGVLFSLTLSGSALAQGRADGGPTDTPSETTVSFLNDFLTVEGRVGDRVVALAREIPAERYGWRPAEGVRSVSEILMHIAAVNLGTARTVGAPMPEGLPTDFSEVTAKDEVLALLEISYQPVRGAASAMAGADIEKPLPGIDGVSLGGGMLIFAEHQGEHLGQLVAYARGLGIVPPWSR